MRPTIASAINFLLEFRSARFLKWSHTLVLTGDSSYISGNVSSLIFSAKNATVTAYLLESPLGRFKKFRLLCYIYCVFVRVRKRMETYSFSSAACLCPLLSREQTVLIQPKHSCVSYIKRLIYWWQKKLRNYCRRFRGTYWNRQLISSVF